MRRELCQDCRLKNTPIAPVARDLLRKVAFDEVANVEDREWLAKQDNQAALQIALSAYGIRRCQLIAKARGYPEQTCAEAQLALEVAVDSTSIDTN